MTLIQIKKRKALAIPSLFRQALKSIYDLENMTSMEHEQMMESLEGWTKHIKLKRQMGFTTIDEDNNQALIIILSLIQQDQAGTLGLGDVSECATMEQIVHELLAVLDKVQGVGQSGLLQRLLRQHPVLMVIVGHQNGDRPSPSIHPAPLLSAA